MELQYRFRHFSGAGPIGLWSSWREMPPLGTVIHFNWDSASGVEVEWRKKPVYVPGHYRRRDDHQVVVWHQEEPVNPVWERVTVILDE